MSGSGSATFVWGANGYEQQASADCPWPLSSATDLINCDQGETHHEGSRDRKVAEQMIRVTAQQSRIGCSLPAAY